MTLTLKDSRPRVLVTREDLPLLRKRAQGTHKPEMDALLSLVKQVQENNQFGPNEHNAIARRLAFLYLLTEDKKHGALAVKSLETALELGVNPNYGAGSARLNTVACCYDWLHDVLPEEMRERVGQRALDQSQALYNSEEVDSVTFLAGHAINQIPYIMMAGQAVGDDFGPGGPHVLRPVPFGKQTNHATDYINDILFRIERMFYCYKHFMDGDSFSQSYAYSLAYTGEIPYLLQLLEKGLGQPGFSANRWFEGSVNWYTYALRPDDTFIRYGDYFCSSSIFKGSYPYRVMASIASRYNNGVARWWANRFQVSGVETDVFLFDDRSDTPEVSPETLPRTKMFGPMGTAIARGDFKNGTIAAMKCSPMYLHNHCHRDQNQITIYHKGELAIDSGAYDGYESPHWKNYYVRTIAHNTLVVHDPEEVIIMRGWPLANDGGQRQINTPDFTPRRPDDIGKECYVDGRVAGYKEGAGYSYFCGDATNCYRKEKLKKFLRHTVFILDWPHKGAVSLLVLDEVEVARAGLRPRILMHTVDKPEVSSTAVTASHRGGKLNMHVLLPNQARLETIGGPGKECLIGDQNFPVDLHADENLATRQAWHNPGAWRVEVSPRDERQAVDFLTLWTPSDIEAPPRFAPKLQLVDGGWIVTQGELTVGLFKPGKTQKLAGERTIVVELAE